MFVASQKVVQIRESSALDQPLLFAIALYSVNPSDPISKYSRLARNFPQPATEPSRIEKSSENFVTSFLEYRAMPP